MDTQSFPCGFPQEPEFFVKNAWALVDFSVAGQRLNGPGKALKFFTFSFWAGG
jgi:hypothetical protein